MTSWITSKSMKFKTSLLLVTLAFQFVIPIFGANELTKATTFTFLEREHMVLTMMVKEKIDLIRASNDKYIADGHIFAQSGTRVDMGVKVLIKEIQSQARQCLETVNVMEILLFKIVGFGQAVELCHKDIKDNDRALALIERYESGAITDHLALVERLNPVLDEITETSIIFASIIPQIVAFVQTLIVSLIIFFSIINAFFIITIMTDLKHRITFIVQKFKSIGETNDLTIRVNYPSTIQRDCDELVQLCGSFNNMMTKFETVVRTITKKSDGLVEPTQALSQHAEATSAQVNQQHVETDQVATAATEMASAIDEIASNTNNAAEAAQQGMGYAETGQVAVNSAISSVDSLSSELENMADVVTQLDTDTKAIGSILDVIRGVAEQTNLLALNAAIEAARAGEQGRGFAVVADEVRSLASRTQQSTAEIHQMIEQLQSGAKKAVDAMQTNREAANSTINEIKLTGETFSNISQATETIRDMTIQIATATEEQTSVINEIHRSLLNIQTLSEDSSSAASSIQETSEVISESSQAMREAVTEFVI